MDNIVNDGLDLMQFSGRELSFVNPSTCSKVSYLACSSRNVQVAPSFDPRAICRKVEGLGFSLGSLMIHMKRYRFPLLCRMQRSCDQRNLQRSLPNTTQLSRTWMKKCLPKRVEYNLCGGTVPCNKSRDNQPSAKLNSWVQHSVRDYSG